jgi:hypothetical protein
MEDNKRTRKKTLDDSTSDVDDFTRTGEVSYLPAPSFPDGLCTPIDVYFRCVDCRFVAAYVGGACGRCAVACSDSQSCEE